MDLNRVLVAGRLTADPELKNLPSGDPVCNFTIAINRRWRDSQTNEERDDALFLDVKCYGKRAPIMKEHFRKGRNVLLDGSLRQERWENKEGQKRSKILLVVERFEFVGPAPVRPGTNGTEAPDRASEPDANPTLAHATGGSTAGRANGSVTAGADETPAPVVPPAEPVRAGSLYARRRREKALAAASTAVDPAQVPF